MTATGPGRHPDGDGLTASAGGRLPARLDETASVLVTLARAVRRTVPEQGPSLAGVPEVLHARWCAAVTARADEAAAAADRILDAAAAVRAADLGYAAADRFVAHRVRGTV